MHLLSEMHVRVYNARHNKHVSVFLADDARVADTQADDNSVTQFGRSTKTLHMYAYHLL
jgi:hypothetical protein